MRALRLPDSFATARLRTERLAPAHFDELRRMHVDPVVMAHLGGVRTEEQTRHYQDINLQHWREHGFGLWIVYERDGIEPIGRALLRYLRVDGVDEVELGYAFYQPFWGRGYATEIVEGCKDYGRRHLGAATFVALVSPENVASRHVLEKAGLRYFRDCPIDNAPHALYRTPPLTGRKR
jgi:ribosomal-protein-alanine N-acetyltransferase